MKSLGKHYKKILRGFTIGEIVITVTIMGTLTALAIPNFLRIRMNVNMELVKQHLKVIGEEMTGIAGRTGKFVAQETWGSGTTEEEMVITANLNGMQNKGYDTDQYTTDENRATYQFRTCPQEGQWGTCGDKCFVLTSDNQITEIEPSIESSAGPWVGWSEGDFAKVGTWAVYTLSPSTLSPQMSLPENAAAAQNAVRDEIVKYAAIAKYLSDKYPSSKNPAVLLTDITAETSNLIQSEDSIKYFAQKGLQIAYIPQPGDPSHTGFTYFTPAMTEVHMTGVNVLLGFKYGTGFDSCAYDGSGGCT